jgi:hypothetical protein
MKASIIGSARQLVLGIAVVSFAAGCVSHPDLKPFAAATAQISASVEANHEGVEQELALMNTDGSFDAQAAKFRASADKIEHAVDSLVRYSDSLVGIAEAGQQAESDARALGDSLNGLVSSVGGGTIIPGKGIELGSMAYGAIAQIVASRWIAKSVQQADPIIESVATLLDKEMDTLDSLLVPDKIE